MLHADTLTRSVKLAIALILVRRELTRYLDQDRRLDTPGLFVKSADHTLSSAAGTPSGSSRMVRCGRAAQPRELPIAWTFISCQRIGLGSHGQPQHSSRRMLQMSFAGAVEARLLPQDVLRRTALMEKHRQVREALDRGQPVPAEAGPHDVAATILAFFAALPAPFMPGSAAQVCDVCVPSVRSDRLTSHMVGRGQGAAQSER